MDRGNPDEVKVTTYDKMLRAWLNSMEMARDFKIYAKEIDDDKNASQIFSDFAMDEGVHAAKFRKLLLDYQNK